MRSRENTKMRIMACILIFMSQIPVMRCQTSSMNYVRQAQMTAPYTSNPTIDFENARITIDYYDGLGHPIQTIKQGASGETLDLCTITEYNSYGLPYRQWLPIEGEQYNGDYINSDNAKTIAGTFYNDSRPFTEIEYDRTMELKENNQYGPGEFWYNENESITTRRGLNAKNDDLYGCTRFDVSATGTLIKNGTYDAGNRFHLGLEWQPMKGLYGYYNNARFRDALLAGTFLQQDPLADKYYGFSPYHYGMNNPLKFIDFDGKKVISSEENSVAFNMKYGQVRNFLKENGLYEQIQAVEESDNYIVTIKDASGDKYGSRYNHIDKILYIDLNHAVEHEKGINSPAFVLRHEFDHAHSHMTDPESHKKRVKTPSTEFKNEEEKRVMTVGDKIAGEKLNEPIRKNHTFIRLINTVNPTTHEIENENNNIK